MTQHMAGVVRAARTIALGASTGFNDQIAVIIDDETHATEMLAFIEEVKDAKPEVSARLRIKAAELSKKARSEK